MSHTAEPDWDLLATYLSGEATDEEAQAVESWIGDDAERRELVERFTWVWEVPDRALDPSMDLATATRAIMGHLDPAASSTDELVHPVPDERAGITRRTVFVGSRTTGHSRWRITAGMGAGIGIGAGIIAMVIAFMFRSSHELISAPRYTTRPGERATVHLAEGSTMILAPSTSATVSPDGIQVTGEAYFTVNAHGNRPFVVHTANATVRVLGTKFSVRQYPEERSSRVVVEDGRVTLRARELSAGDMLHRNALATLSARMMASVTDSGVAVTDSIVPRDYVEWIHGVLVFNRATLRDVIADLERMYGAKIRVADTTLAQRRMHLDVSVADQPLSLVLDHICDVLDAHYSQDNHTFVLSPGHAAAKASERDQLRHHDLQPEHQYGK